MAHIPSVTDETSAGLRRLMREAAATQDDLGAAVGVTGSAITHKLAGRRAWSQDEINAVLNFLSRRLRRRVKYEEVFRSHLVGAERR